MPPNIRDYGEPIDRLIRSYEATMQVLAFSIQIFTKGQVGHFTDSFWNRILNGPVKHWQSLRSALLRIHVDGFDNEKFVGPSPAEHTQYMPSFEFSQSRMLSARVAEWTKSSRRVYHVPVDLQLLLMTTSLEGVDWSMVKLPFDSFLISFDQPLVFKSGVIDSILIARETWGYVDTLGIQTIVTTIPTMESVFVGDQRLRIAKAIEKGDAESLAYALDKLSGAIKNRMTDGGGLWLTQSNCLAPNGFISKFEKSERIDNESRFIFRIIFGLLLYLQSRPSRDVTPRGWEKSSPAIKSASRLIRIPSEVCLVRSIYTLDDSERRALSPVLRGNYAEVTPHHREGHWRRPPGRGNDPTHKKTVWVRPAIVRPDKLGEGGLPPGSTEHI